MPTREWSPLVTHFQVNLGDSDATRPGPVVGIGHHHTATTSKSGALTAFLPGGRTVTPNYFIAGKEIWGIVPENRRPWTSSSRAYDGQAITYEILNATGDPNWSFTAETLDTVARLDAEISRFYGIPFVHAKAGYWEHKDVYIWSNGTEGYATACAGPSFNIAARIAQAKAIGVPMTLEAKFREFCGKYPKASLHPYGSSNADGSWDQMCGNLMFRIGEAWVPGWAPRVTGPTAWDVALASAQENPNAAAAPVGAIHWFKSPGGGAPGHVGLDLTGGGVNVGMATYAVRESLGAAIGIQSVAGYVAAKSFMTYIGWTLDYAGATYAAAIGDGTPTPTDQGDIMARYQWNDARGGLLVKGEVGGIYYPKNLEEAQSLLDTYGGRAVSTRQWDVARQASLNILADGGGTLGVNQAALDALFQKIAERIDAIDDNLTADVDEAGLAAEIAPLLKSSGIEAHFDPVELSAAFKANAEDLAKANAKLLAERLGVGV